VSIREFSKHKKKTNLTDPQFWNKTSKIAMWSKCT